MLREHAFDAAASSRSIGKRQQELEQEVVRDYWRTFYYPLDAGLGVTGYWKSPISYTRRAQTAPRKRRAGPPARTQADLSAAQVSARTANQLKPPGPHG